MAYRDYPSRMPQDALEKAKFLRKLGLEHLLRVWQWFEVYQLSPYRMPYFAMQKEQYADGDKGDGGDGGDGGEGRDGFRIIDLENGLVLYDFGDYLATSAGEDYGPLSTGRLLRTVDKMMGMLEKRGATEIAFGKECLGSAKLYAWHRAVERNIRVHDYQPSAEDIRQLTETYGPIEPRMEEKVRPL